MNYIFAPKGGSVYDINAEFTVEGKTVPLVVNAAPLKRNYRTNIVGDLLLASGQFDVVVDPNFGGDEVVDLDEIAFRTAVANGEKGVVSKNMTLTKRFSLTKNTSPEIVVEKGATLTAELSDYGKVIALFNKGINCTLSGEGRILGPLSTNIDIAYAAITIDDNTNSLTVNGNLTIEAREGRVTGISDACIVIYSGKVTVNGGHFISSKMSMEMKIQEFFSILLMLTVLNL